MGRFFKASCTLAFAAGVFNCPLTLGGEQSPLPGSSVDSSSRDRLLDFKKSFAKRGESEWAKLVRESIDEIQVGKVTIGFNLTKSGAIQKVWVVENSANEVAQDLAIRAILMVKKFPIPNDLHPLLKNDVLKMEWSFQIVVNPAISK